MAAYLQALGLTLGTELPLLAGLCWLARRPLGRPGLTHLGVNLLTHPALWLLFPLLGGEPGTRLLLMELAVMGIEAALLFSLGHLRPLALAVGIAVAVNAASWAAGLWLL